jgi:signal peptidase I
MRSLAFKVVGGVVVGAIALGLWVFFAPTKVGGSTTYSVTSGISMEPLLHKNDLAFVRSQSSYHVGDIVLYQSSVVHKPVLHRIILIQNGNYFFKGDNNGFVDPGYATRSELVGTLWFHVPKVGVVLGWLGTPAHAALLAGFAVMVIALTGSTTKSRRRRRRGSKAMVPKHERAKRSTPPIRAARDDTGGDSRGAARRRPQPFLEGPTSTLMSLGVALALALLFLGIGFSRPLQVTGGLPNAYQQSGTFSYSAAPKTPTAVYPTGVVSTGDPIYPSLVEVVNLRFGYRFTSSLPHSIKGTLELRALVLSQADTWQEVSTVVPIADFVGDKTFAATDLSLASLYTLIGSVSAESGVAGTNYSVDVQPVVHIKGTVDGRRIDQKFSPVLPFAVTTTAIRVDVAVAPPPPGATYVPSTAATALLTALHPSQSGSIPHLVTNVISIAKYKVPVSALRTLGIVLAVLAVALAVVHDRRRRRGTRRSAEELIAKQLHTLIVPVAALGPSQMPIEVTDFTQLAGLARFLERPILYQVGNGRRTYAVDDENRRYVTSAIERRAPREPRESTETGSDGTRGGGDTAPTQPDAPTVSGRMHRKQVADSTPARTRPRGALLARVGAAVFLLAVIATLTVSFTASTSVPPSSAGRSVVPGAVSQATPAGCSALALTTLVRGSGTFSTNESHALVLGSAGVDTISAPGTFNCIIGGAGKDKVTSTSSSVCIIGPTTGSTYTNCVKKTG